MPTPDDRIYGDITDIDYQDTQAFFNHRGRRAQEVGLLSATLYQDHCPQLAIERDAHEKQTVLPLLENLAGTRVLDLGCGTGRWGFFLHDQIGQYLGIDFSPGLIEAALAELARHPRPKLEFQVLSVLELDPSRLASAPPFNLFLISGLLLYLNDQDVRRLLRQLPALAAAQACLYVREPIGIEARLTLNKHFSDDLQHAYSAIYRTEDEYRQLFTETLSPFGFQVEVAMDLLPPHLLNRKDTKQRIYLIKRRPHA